MEKLLLVFNPYSGTGKIRNALADVVDIFTKAGYETTVYPTQAPGDGMHKIVLDGLHYGRIVVAGGDGMLHEAVNAVQHLPKQVPLGYLPTGTVNDFATANGVPKNVLPAAHAAVSQNIRAVDVGRFNDEYFSYVAAFGFATQVSYETAQDVKNRLGFFAYVLNVIKNINPVQFDAACARMCITAGTMQLEGEFLFGAISNSTSIGGMKYPESGVELDDGLLEGFFIRKPRTLADWEAIQRSFLERRFSSEAIVAVHAPQFTITSDKTAWTLDGENGGEHENVLVQAVPKALHIALPE